ncbi:DUF695 domain-containing protein [Chitinophaga sp. GCM10012297]|uniref:DUF695 domain-containing protein n=1 Tax=Chitinophaga chungangae TaxID=2821488 RepID=A0ABS3YH22_9BACT|nr:DUF695 domain-containing protein [Chitinophaga chungangae]MBO9154003.1 DUF695 domain-containing protein [Chitinophaga chungangae]
MRFISRLFGKKEHAKTNTHAAFWAWFASREKEFYKVLFKGTDIDSRFMDKVIPQLHQLNVQFYCLAGKYDEQTVEMVISAEGDIKSFVFVEDLVADAPALPGWKFTALKPGLGFDIKIGMGGYEFSRDNISFYSNESSEYPDQIDITFVHPGYTEENHKEIGNGIVIFLENALGELDTATLIDNIDFGPADSEKELIPLEKLEDFLRWREKEFVEKYKATRSNSDNDLYSVVEGRNSYNMPLIACINSELLEWDAKPSHPWMMVVEHEFEWDESGMPSAEMHERLGKFEDELLAGLAGTPGHLYLGRNTEGGSCFIYIACREFREISRQTAARIEKYLLKRSVNYRIYKDKYWMTMEKFIPAP